MASFNKDDMWRETRGLDVKTWFWNGGGGGGVVLGGMGAWKVEAMF
jgi:hypothetical protein